jgi:hypothetical protein
MIDIAGGILLALFLLWLASLIIRVAGSIADEARTSRESRRNHEEVSKMFDKAGL